jgi:signal transduction histidine kinase/CheY-like chemotaxis protein
MKKKELMLRIAIVIFFVEAAILIGIAVAADYYPILKNELSPFITLADIVALALISSPIMYYWAITPFVLSQTKEQDKRAEELVIANAEKDQRAEERVLADEEKDKRVAELVIADEEKDQRAEELVIANAEKDKRVAELVIANEEKDQRAEELVIADAEKYKRVAELVIANEEKDQRAEELVIANVEKDQRAEELVIADEEKDKRVAELVIANAEKDQRAEELVIANAEKDRRVSELIIATAAKDQFLTSMSHELRTPLNAIIGLSKALVSDTKMIRSSQESEYIVAIHSSGQHLLKLIGDVLDLSKLNAGARSLEKEPFTILELMEECRNTFEVACQDKGVSLNIDNQLKGACPVLSDITVLKQILYNLLGNAVKFTQQGSISLTAVPYVAEGIDPNPNLGIMFIVADTGKGINADAIGTLFDPFTQEDNGITRSFGGSGLGLNIAQSLAQLMGGEISCNSIVGQGSIFEVTVYLEQQPKSFEILDFDNSDGFELPPLKLLVVDDVALNLMVAVALLKPKGHIIETAESGYKALEMASNNDYDAILMDVHMPGIDGLETTRRIHNCANKKRAAVPILALSADVDVAQKALFIASGMDATMSKPLEVEVLEKELKRILKLG